jgi:hypothetical protein
MERNTMTTTDQANIKAVEKAVSDLTRPANQTYIPKDRQSLLEVIHDMERLAHDLETRLEHAKKIIALVVGGLK